MMNRRGFMLTLTTGLVALGFVVGTVIADELMGTITKVDVDGKVLTVVQKDSDKEIKIKVTDKTEAVGKGGTPETRPGEAGKERREGQDAGDKGVQAKIFHEENVASKIQSRGRRRRLSETCVWRAGYEVRAQASDGALPSDCGRPVIIKPTVRGLRRCADRVRGRFRLALLRAARPSRRRACPSTRPVDVDAQECKLGIVETPGGTTPVDRAPELLHLLGVLDQAGPARERHVAMVVGRDVADVDLRILADLARSSLILPG